MRELKSKKSTDKPVSVSTILNNGKDGELGLIKIHENVVSSLVRKAALGVEGVSRLAGSTFVDNLAEIVGSRKISDRAISIQMDEDKLEIELKINMKFGYKVPEVASNVQTAIIEEVENVTGMNVVCVNVIVQEIEDVAENDDDSEDQDDSK